MLELSAVVFTEPSAALLGFDDPNPFYTVAQAHEPYPKHDFNKQDVLHDQIPSTPACRIG